MNASLTSYLAAWGAALSTFTAVWNVWKWHREKPRIAAKVEARESFETDGFSTVTYELRNRGDKPTTIEEIMLVSHEGGLSGRLFGYGECCSYESVSNRNTVQLPAVLRPGEIWKGYSVLPEEERVPIRENKSKLIAAGKLAYRIRCAHTDKLICGKIKPERF